MTGYPIEVSAQLHSEVPQVSASLGVVSNVLAVALLILTSIVLGLKFGRGY